MGTLSLTQNSESTIIITEVDRGDPDFIEIQNVSGSSLDLTGYYVACSGSYANFNVANQITWNLNGVVPAGWIDYRDDDPFSANYWGLNILFHTATNTPGWVAICDSSHNIIDIMFWGWTAVDLQNFAPNVGGNILSFNPSHWMGDGLAGECATGSMSRSTSIDNNNVSDWVCGTTSTPGTSNITISPVIADPISSILWSTMDTTLTISPPSAGTYTIQVDYVSGCVGYDTVTLVAPAQITVTTSITDIICFGEINGTASISTAGGTGTINVDWGTNDPTMLEKGYSTYIITDSVGCTLFDSVYISEPTLMDLNLTGQSILCFGDSSNGSADAVVTGGWSGYSYTWSTGDTTNTVSGLPAGWHSVNVVDANGCSMEDSVEIIEPTLLDLSVMGESILCFGDIGGGSAEAMVSGGTLGYTYSWSTGDSTNTVTGLTEGWHSVNVVDANGCTIEDSVEIIEPTLIDLILTGQSILCYGDIAGGSADAVVTGGTPGYSYSWSNGDTTNMVTGLSAGWHILSVVDLNGCVMEDSVEIIEPTEMALNAILSDEIIGNDGSIDLTVSGGTAPYSFSWTNGAGNVEDPTGLAGGLYIVTVTDSNGCTSTEIYGINSQVGIDEMNTLLFKVIPNPNNGDFKLLINSSSGSQNLEILNSVGQIVYADELSSSEKYISLPSMQVGVYFVRVFNKSSSTVERMIIH